MIFNYNNGFDFVSANPALHTGVKRLQIPTQAKQMLTYFDDLIHEITDEFMRYLKTKYPDTHFLAAALPSTKHDAKMPMVTLLSHCFPILYGLQQRSENAQQALVNRYLRERLSDTQAKLRERVCLLIFIFHQLTESKQLLHIIAFRAEKIHANYTYPAQLNALVKAEIQAHCNNIAKALDQCRFNIASTPKEQNIFAGLISRTKGFASFTEKKLRAFCAETA